MKKKLFVLGVLLAIGTNVNFVEAAGALTNMTSAEFKDESTSSSALPISQISPCRRILINGV